MSEKFALVLEKRTLVGKKVNRLRREGTLPATVYGKNVGPLTVQLNARAFSDVFRKAGKTSIVELSIPGEPKLSAFVHTYQIHPVSRLVTHVDFLVVDLKTEVTVEVPVHLVGESPLVKLGEAVLNHILSAIQVRALPNDIPSALEADVSVLDAMDKNVHVSDVKLPDGVVAVTDGEQIIASVTPARVVEEEPTEETPAEPELVGDDKDEENSGE